MASSSMSVRVCAQCKTDLPLQAFSENRSVCKKCRYKNAKKAHENRIESGVMKTCTDCKTEKHSSDFRPGSAVCKPCWLLKAAKHNVDISEGQNQRACSMCKKVKAVTSFAPFSNVCRTCCSIKARSKIATIVRSLKMECANCKNSNPNVLKFVYYDARERTRTESGRALSFCALMSRKSILSEESKGRFLCGNCQRAELYKDFPKLDDTLRAHAKCYHPGIHTVYNEKMTRGCCHDCSKPVTEATRQVFDFDHRDPSQKSFNISSVGIKKYKPEELRAELDKCDLCCSNCHMERTLKQKRGLKRKLESGEESGLLSVIEEDE